MSDYFLKRIVLLCALFCVASCGSGGDLETVFRVRAANLSPDSPVQNVVVGSLEFALDFTNASSFSSGSPGDLTLEVRGFSPVEVGVAPEDDLILRPAETVTFQADTDYTIITYGSGDDLQLLLVSNPSPGVFASETSRFRFSNVSGSGSLDVYVTEVDADLSTATPFATVNPLQTSDVTDQATGTIQIRVTQTQTTDVLFDSGPLTIESPRQLLWLIGDTPLIGGAPLRLYSLQDTESTPIVDINTPALVRLLQLSPDTPAVDVYVNDETLTSPIFSNVAFGDLTGYLDFPGVETEVDITAAGDTGTVLLEEQVDFALGLEQTYFITGLSGNLSASVTADSLRSVSTEVRLRLIQGAPIITGVDVYVVETGTALTTDTVPFVQSLGLGVATTFQSILPGDYDVWFTQPGDVAATVLGPRPLTLVEGGVYTLVARNSDTGSSVQFLLINDQ